MKTNLKKGTSVMLFNRKAKIVEVASKKVKLKFLDDKSEQWFLINEVASGNFYTLDQVAKKMGVTKPSILHHIDQMNIEIKRVPLHSGHKEIVMSAVEALKLLATRPPQGDKMVPLRKIAEDADLTYVAVDYHCRKKGITKYRRKNKNNRPEVVVSFEDAKIIKKELN